MNSTIEGPSYNVHSLKRNVPEGGMPPTTPLHFDRYEMNVRPFVLPRSLDTYKHFILVFEVSSEDPRYSELYTFLENWMKQTKFTIGKTHPVDMTKHTDKHHLFKLSPDKVYFCDLRTQKDPRCGLHLTVHPEPWVSNQAASIALDQFRGLIVFADHLEQVPACWVSKSIGGLTAKPNIDSFLKKGLGVQHNLQAIAEDNCLHGYIKMIRHAWMAAF